MSTSNDFHHQFAFRAQWHIGHMGRVHLNYVTQFNCYLLFSSVTLIVILPFKSLGQQPVHLAKVRNEKSGLDTEKNITERLAKTILTFRHKQKLMTNCNEITECTAIIHHLVRDIVP